MKKNPRSGSGDRAGFRLSFIGSQDGARDQSSNPNISRGSARGGGSALKEETEPPGPKEVWYPLCLEGHRDIINCLLFLGSSRIASGSDDGTLAIWDTRSGKMISQIKAHKHAILCMALLQRGQELPQTDQPDQPSQIQRSPFLITGSIDKTLKVWDLETFECAATLTGHTGRVSCVVVLENITSSMIVVPDHRSRRMSISGIPDLSKIDTSSFDLADHVQQTKHNHTDNINRSRSKTTTPSATPTLPHKDLNHNASTPAVLPATNTPEAKDNRTTPPPSSTNPTQQPQQPPHLPTNTTNKQGQPLSNEELAGGGETTQLFCSGGSDGVLIVWSIRGQEFQIQRQENDHLNCLLQVQNYLITGSNAKYVLVYDLLTLSYKTLLSCHRDSVRCLMKVTENFFLSGSLDGIIRMWDVKTFLPVVTLENPKEYMKVSDQHKFYNCPVVSVACLFDEYFVAAIGKGFKVFDAHLKVCVKEVPKAHKSVIVEVLPLMGGIDFVTCSEDSTIKIWSIATEQKQPAGPGQPVPGGTGGVEFNVDCKTTLTKHQMAVRKLCAFSTFSFASGGADNKIYLWRHSGVTPSFERRSTMIKGRSSYLLGRQKELGRARGKAKSAEEDFTVKKYNSFRVFEDYEPDGFHSVSVAFEKYSVSETILDYVKGLVYDRQLDREEILQILENDGHGKSVLRNIQLFLDDCDDA